MKVYSFLIGRRARDSSYFFLHTDCGKEITMSYYFWAVRHGREITLIDTGFCKSHLENRKAKVMNFTSTDELLNRAGVKPSEVNTLILTHLHWDHSAAIDLFDKAKIICQKDDFEFFTNKAIRQLKPLTEFADKEAIMSLKRLYRKGRLVLMDGGFNYSRNITVFKTPGHTPGSQSIKIAGRKKNVIICGDAVPFKKNQNMGIPSGIYIDLIGLTTSMKKLQSMMREGDVLIPGHDPDEIAGMKYCQGVGELHV
jgi:glyoxylase-like metal-dependent hydrolase (beta-lactamase superfamily II)